MDVQEKQKLVLLFVIFGIAGLIGYYNLLLKPQFSRFIVNNKEYYAIKRRVKAAESLIANKDNINRQYENFSTQVGLLGKRFLEQEEISTLLEDFSSIAESSGVKILKIKPMEVLDDVSQDGGGSSLYSKFAIFIEAASGYHQCGEFISKVENMDRFIKIEGIDIRARAGDPRRHNIKLEMSTYVEM